MWHALSTATMIYFSPPFFLFAIFRFFSVDAFRIFAPFRFLSFFFVPLRYFTQISETANGIRAACCVVESQTDLDLPVFIMS